MLQRSWDAVAIAHGKTALDAHYIDPIDRARLLAVSAPHAGDWLNIYQLHLVASDSMTTRSEWP